MAESIIELTAYAIILPVHTPPRLNIVEETVLQYMREGYSQSSISQLLGFNISVVIEELRYKKYLFGDGSFKILDESDYALVLPKEYKHCFIFKKENQALFYDRIIYAHEIRLRDHSVLTNDLGDEYVKNSILKKLFIFETFPVKYEPTQKENPPTRKITDYKGVMLI
jgi:hypothetical protein